MKSGRSHTGDFMKRSVESSVEVTPCRWKHFLLDNHLREKGTAGFYLIGTILTLASSGKAMVATTLYRPQSMERLI